MKFQFKLEKVISNKIDGNLLPVQIYVLLELFTKGTHNAP